MKQYLQAGVILFFSVLLISACKKDNAGTKRDSTQPKIILTKSGSGDWELYVDAAAADRSDVWIDLNNNGVKDSGESITKFGFEWSIDRNIFSSANSKTVTLYGKVTGLDCSFNDLTTLDLSQNTALRSLTCAFNYLKVLDLSKNTALTDLICNENALTSLDISKNTALINLDFGKNKLKSLDVSRNAALKSLSFLANELTALDVSKNGALEVLNGSINKFTVLDLSKNVLLKRLDCRDNQLTVLDLSKNTALEELYCGENKLTVLDLSKNTALKNLTCHDNQLTKLDVSKSPSISELTIYKNNISGINMTTFVDSLPIRVAADDAKVYIQNAGGDGNSVPTAGDLIIGKGKMWKFFRFVSGSWVQL